MGMGIVSDEDFDAEVLNSAVADSPIPSINPTGVVINPLDRPGRSDGDMNVPDSLRKIIGETSELDGRPSAIALAKEFGISPSSVSAYANGSRSTKSYDKQPNLSHINNAKERISKKARIRLMKALNHITDDKLEGSKAVDLASIARSMSGIVKEMEPEIPKDPLDGKSGPTFIFYSPQVKEEKHYDVITVRE
jgi:predicted transcriptional regulator